MTSNIKLKSIVRSRDELNTQLRGLKSIVKYIKLLEVPSILAWSYLKYKLYEPLNKCDKNSIDKAKELLEEIKKEAKRFSIEGNKFIFPKEFDPEGIFDLISLIEIGRALSDLNGKIEDNLYVVNLKDLKSYNERYSEYMEAVSKHLWKKEFDDLVRAVELYRERILDANEALEVIPLNGIEKLELDNILIDKLKKMEKRKIQRKLEELRSLISMGWLPYSFLKVEARKKNGEDKDESKDKEYLLKELIKEALWWAVWDNSLNENYVRNFIAHAGLEKNLTFVSSESVGYYIPYLEQIISIMK